ncbi:MAG: hypothetical protein M3Y82_01120 [Verrucomicrobiota bacterium]|nr:hypothetical protein [Verrucomicrobiota bacterium]
MKNQNRLGDKFLQRRSALELRSKRADHWRRQATLRGIPEFIFRLIGSRRLPFGLMKSDPKHRHD